MDTKLPLEKRTLSQDGLTDWKTKHERMSSKLFYHKYSNGKDYKYDNNNNY